MIHEKGWCPIYAPSEAAAYQYDHLMQKYDVPWSLYCSIKYAMHHVHRLSMHPPEIAIVKQEECMGNVKRDLHWLYLCYQTEKRPVVAFKGGT